MKCWDFKGCPEDVRNICPAYPENGNDCWTIDGTKCDEGLLDRLLADDRLNYCYTCAYYIFFAHKRQ